MPKINYSRTQNILPQSVTQVISPEFYQQQRANPILNRSRDDIPDPCKHLDPIPSDLNTNYTYGWRKPCRDTMKTLIQYQPTYEFLGKLAYKKQQRN